MKINFLIACTLLFSLNACKTDQSADKAQEAIQSGAGIQPSQVDTAAAAYAAKLSEPTGALPDQNKQFCFGAGNTVLKIQEANSTIMGTYVAFDKSKKILDGKFLGVFQNDTIKGMVLSMVNNVSKPQDVWFKKDGDNYKILNATTAKDEKGAFKIDPKSLKEGDVLTMGACK